MIRATANASKVALSDAQDSVRVRLTGVDLVAFNPPYVVTPDEEVDRGGIAAAWAGGYKGRAVINRVLDTLEGLVAPGGRVYMIAIHENEPEDIMERMRGKGFVADMIATRVADEEVLHVLRFTKTNQNRE